MEKTGSNMEEEGRGAESNHGQIGKQKKSKPKRKSREALVTWGNFGYPREAGNISVCFNLYYFLK